MSEVDQRNTGERLFAVREAWITIRTLIAVNREFKALGGKSRDVGKIKLVYIYTLAG